MSARRFWRDSHNILFNNTRNLYIYIIRVSPLQIKSGCAYGRNQILVSRTLLRLQCSSPLSLRRFQINDKMLTMCVCHFCSLSSPQSFSSTCSLLYGINHKVPHIIHRVFVRGVEELSISHFVVESMYRAVRCLSSDLAFVHSRFVIASVRRLRSRFCFSSLSLHSGAVSTRWWLAAAVEALTRWVLSSTRT